MINIMINVMTDMIMNLMTNTTKSGLSQPRPPWLPALNFYGPFSKIAPPLLASKASRASKALGEHLVLREGHDLLREVTEPSCGGTGLVAHHVFGGDGIAQNLQSSKAEKIKRGPKRLGKAGDWDLSRFIGILSINNMDLMGYITIFAGNKEISTKNIQKNWEKEWKHGLLGNLKIALTSSNNKSSKHTWKLVKVPEYPAEIMARIWYNNYFL